MTKPCCPAMRQICKIRQREASVPDVNDSLIAEDLLAYINELITSYGVEQSFSRCGSTLREYFACQVLLST